MFFKDESTIAWPSTTDETERPPLRVDLSDPSLAVVFGDGDDAAYVEDSHRNRKIIDRDLLEFINKVSPYETVYVSCSGGDSMLYIITKPRSRPVKMVIEGPQVIDNTVIDETNCKVVPGFSFGETTISICGRLETESNKVLCCKSLI